MKALILILLILNIFCWSSCTNQSSKMEKQKIITTYSELITLEGKPVWIKGKYAVHNPYPKGSKVRPSNLPIKIVLEDDEEVFLEPFWHSSSIQNPKSIELFKERIVCVKGVFYSEMPPDERSEGKIVSTMGGACLFPVDSIVLAE